MRSQGCVRTPSDYGMVFSMPSVEDVHVVEEQGTLQVPVRKQAP
jgi:hypothetical protein